jgi:nitrite reductase/ring-hydroxylating ferredoxin subunit
MRIPLENRIIEVIDGISFVRTYKSDDVYEGKGKKIEFDEDVDMQVAIFRVKGKLHCFSNICPHRHQPDIFNSILQGNRISCPQHAWTYYIETGMNVNQRQGIKNLKKFSIFEKDGWVYIEIPELHIPKWREVPLSR